MQISQEDFSVQTLIDMGVKMVQKTPLVRQDTLLYIAEEQEHSMAVESSEWWLWLDQFPNSSFRYQSSSGGFTALREHISQGAHWYAYSNQQGTLYKHYLGKAHELTHERLQMTATALSDELSLPTAPISDEELADNREEDNIPSTKALQEALAANDLERIEKLLLIHKDTLLKRSDAATLRQWLDRLPMASIRRTPHLYILQAWIALLDGQFLELQYCLNLAEQAFPLEEETAPVGEIAVLQAILAYAQQDLARAAHASHLALHLLPADSPWRVAVLITQSRISRHSDHRQLANTRYQKAIHLSQQIEMFPDVVNTLCKKMLVENLSAPATSLIGALEHKVLISIAKGHTVREIAHLLSISEEDVNIYIKKIYSSLNVQNRAQVITKARALDLL